MEWWYIPLGIGVVALLRYLWVSRFLSRETVSAVPKLDAYIPGRHETARHAGEAPVETPGGPDAVAGDTGDESAGADDPGTWIEIDIEPLFPSSDSAATYLVDLTGENETETSS
jgi:hypothetical protein